MNNTKLDFQYESFKALLAFGLDSNTKQTMIDYFSEIGWIDEYIDAGFMFFKTVTNRRDISYMDDCHAFDS